MGRSRVLSFMSTFGPAKYIPGRDSQDSSPAASTAAILSKPQVEPKVDNPSPDQYASATTREVATASAATTMKPERFTLRPASMAFSLHPPTMDVTEDTLPELFPIFTFLNSHSNKLYQEGYFLKLNDLDSHGRPCPDRQWVEYFAQLIGTVLSLWDASALDAAGEDGEVAPTFINLADASIKMIDKLPTRNPGTQPLQNVLSISTAGKNRYLLHFNSFHSLTQWTAGIRLAMFEHASLQEAYTGSIIAGKGKSLNNIRSIMERNRFKQEDWARVRFGAGTPWRRCWCVINPPDEKQYQKLQKSMKKKSAYDRAPPMPTGSVEFYETKKTKKTKPIATITDAYAAYAIYPQSKPLIDQSTLVKIEGQIAIHSQPESSTEGFVFIMPEVHPAISGFEMMLRFLFPVFDTFSLYGRPTRLLADTNHTKSIMFAFPKHKRYGYLDILDVANLIQKDGSRNWSEREWRKQLKDATSRRMATQGSRTDSVRTHRQRASLPSRNGTLQYRDTKRSVTTPAVHLEFNQSADAVYHDTPKTETVYATPTHTRAASDTTGFAMGRQREPYVPTPMDKPHVESVDSEERPSTKESSERTSSDSSTKEMPPPHVETVVQHLRPSSPPSPVVSPPAFAHSPGEVPNRPLPSPDLRKAKARMSDATLSQLVEAGNLSRVTSATEHKNPGAGKTGQREVIHDDTSMFRSTANANVSPQRTPGNKTATPDERPPPVPVHGSSDLNTKVQEATRSSTQRNSYLPQIDTAKAIARKPLPQRRPEPPADSPSEASLGSFRHAFDEEALNRVVARQTSFSTDHDIRPDEESVYDDDASTVSPDYASTRKSIDSRHSQQSIQRPRMGVLKTVGGDPEPKELVIGDAKYTRDASSTPKAEIPAFDFGPTLAYDPTTKSPHASDPLGQFGHHRKGSDATLGPNDRGFLAAGRKSPGAAMLDRPHSRSPSGDELRRNIPWQPGMASARPSTPGQTLTPEQFVQQRAVINRKPSPAYAHQRSSSMTPPPRPSSGDWSANTRRQSYNKELPTRPQSRGAGSTLGYKDISSHLSAREQEHVARVTGSSFFNISSNNSRQQAPVNPAGLVGAIDARERERKSMREGMSNQMVEYAIAQRHQQEQAQMYAMHQHARGQSMYNLPTANRTWDTFNQMDQAYTVNGRGQQPWAGHFQSQQSTPTSQPNQYFQQFPGTYSDGGMQFSRHR
ncbi:PH domain protein [Paecilomyces variotii No. 5]|uniref:PH domain protein n=1 Tax=Byssochlamys spectabilis (strain No. 5 / NBRC 109023) TaxID=1356009 RepID=V5G0L4_BYSSN|nr:PH domain protein [Paecilomyces variotii No. 5]